jgi:phosphoribosylformylglycinamidine (FGAM) synthase-like enzyme
MTQEHIDWILAQAPQALNRYRALFATAGRPSYFVQEWSEQMGGSAWCTVLSGLADKWSDCVTRAHNMNMTFDLTLKHLADKWLAQRGRCSVTGLIMTFESGTTKVRNPYRCSVDRINSNRGYTADNIRLLTHWANNAYNTWDDALFEQMILASAERIRLRG